jgi:hypothetical protein
MESPKRAGRDHRHSAADDGPVILAELFIFGLGYSARVFANRMTRQGWTVSGTGSRGTIRFEDEAAVRVALASADAVLSSVPPDSASGADPVLARYGSELSAAPARWIGYLSSTGVYGDTGGAWVDETAPIGAGRRSDRAAADLAWQTLHRAVRVFRLPGIYGPGRSALDRVRAGTAHRIDLPDQIFSRVHVDDIASGLVASLADGPPGVFNLADDHPASQNAVVEQACALLGLVPPLLLGLDDAGLSPMARGFYGENRRVANGKAKRLLGWQPTYPDYRAGLAALL